MRRLATAGTALTRAAVVALAVHAIVYRSLFPADGVHGYFAWYTPLVGGLSAGALLVAVLAVLARITGVGRSWTRRWVVSPDPGVAVSAATSWLAAQAIAFLSVQETLERSIPARAPVLVQFTPLDWLVVLSATACIAFALVSAGRGCQLLVRRLRPPSVAARARRVPRGLPARSVALVAWPPLASFSGLRAPPSLVRA